MLNEFETWQRETLIQFAQEANEKIKQQQAEIDALRADLKLVLTAWRNVVPKL